MHKNNKSRPILYSFRRCPFAIRARTAIYFSELEVELREVSLKNKPLEMLKISPKGTVPVLHYRNFILEESIEIILWALKKSDNNNLLIPYKEKKYKTLSYIKSFDNQFKYHLDRYKYTSRFKVEFDNLFKIKHRDLGMRYIHFLESLLADNQLFLYKNKMSLLDICIFPLVRQFRIADINWFDRQISIPLTKKWLLNILESDFFNAVMYKYNEWKITKESYIFSNYKL